MIGIALDMDDIRLLGFPNVTLGIDDGATGDGAIGAGVPGPGRIRELQGPDMSGNRRLRLTEAHRAQRCPRNARTCDFQEATTQEFRTPMASHPEQSWYFTGRR
jgi:hypothetical protein